MCSPTRSRALRGEAQMWRRNGEKLKVTKTPVLCTVSFAMADIMPGSSSLWRRRLNVIAGHIEEHAQLDTQRLETSLTSAEVRNALVISDDVRTALESGKPVVALESTIITHGMPYPQNLQTANEVEAVVRSHGAVPATIAVLQGVPHVGLSQQQLKYLAKAGLKVRKTSRRDLPLVMALRQDGATTVSATMLLASRAGIAVFVTGGIGGVHRGAESSMDISADLTELGRTPVAVICAGVKSILDIPRTLEYLETQGVCVAAYRSREFPAFFTPRSGCAAPCSLDSPAQVAAVVHASARLGLEGGMVLGVPIPSDQAAAGAEVEAAIQQALQESDTQGIRGNDITPFLLQRIQELTQGRSLQANIALVKNNAQVGAAVARELCQLRTR